MSNPAINALRARVATNTLTVSDISALTTALDFITLSFEGPDETAQVPFSDEDNAREWIAALYTIAAGGGGGAVPPVTFGSVIEPSAAALTAVDVTSLLNGQPAIVESYGAEFSLQPKGSLTVDGPTGGTVLASNDPARVWVRGDTVDSQAALAQTVWHVNRSTGSNENTGLDAGHALLTKSEISRRMGGWSPTVPGTHATFSIDAADTDGTDPWLFDPAFAQGATWILTAPLPAAGFTGSLNVVTAKNRAGNQTLASSFTTTTGAIAVGMLLVNATRGNSRAFVVSSLGGGVFRLSQPLAPSTPPAAPVTTEVDTWVHGDAISGFVLSAVDVAKLGGTTATFDGGFDLSMSLFQVKVFDPSGAGIDQMQVNGKAATGIADVACQRSPYLNPGNNLLIQAANVLVLAAECVALANAGDGSNTTGQFAGGAIAAAAVRMGQVKLFSDIILTGGSPSLVNMTSGDIYYDGGVAALEGITLIGGVQYGTGTLNSLGSVNYGSEPSAVTAFPLTGGLQINSEANAYSNHTPGGVGTATTVNLVALTPAHLDAAAGVAGFGGLAYIPGVGSFTNGSVAP